MAMSFLHAGFVARNTANMLSQVRWLMDNILPGRQKFDENVHRFDGQPVN
jgi:hypothetical protein